MGEKMPCGHEESVYKNGADDAQHYCIVCGLGALKLQNQELQNRLDVMKMSLDGIMRMEEQKRQEHATALRLISTMRPVVEAALAVWTETPSSGRISALERAVIEYQKQTEKPNNEATIPVIPLNCPGCGMTYFTNPVCIKCGWSENRECGMRKVISDQMDVLKRTHEVGLAGAGGPHMSCSCTWNGGEIVRSGVDCTVHTQKRKCVASVGGIKCMAQADYDGDLCASHRYLDNT